MRKTMTKIFALVLVCAMIIGFVAMIPAQAAPVVEIVANNVGFDEKLHMMYAIKADTIPETGVVIELTDKDSNSLGVATREEELKMVKGVECAIFIAEEGIAVQDIAREIFASVKVNGEEVATGRRSVLEYLYSQILTNTTITAEQKEMNKSLLAYAGALQTVLMGPPNNIPCDDITQYSYVKVINGTVDGKFPAGMLKTSDPDALAKLEANFEAAAGKEIRWKVTVFDSVNDEGVTYEAQTKEQVAEYFAAGKQLVLEAVEVDAGTQAPTWNLVTSASELNVGDQVVIVAKDANFALSATQNNNNRGQAAVTKEGTTVTFGNDTQVLTLAAGTTSGTFAFYTGDGYLYAASSSNNYLKTQTKLDANGSWVIAIADDGEATVTAQGTNTRNVMQYNSSSGLFACYGSASQKAIVIYKLTGGTSVEPEPDEPETSETTEVTVPSETEETTPSAVETPVEMNIYASTGKLNGTASISWTSDDGGVTFTAYKGGTAIRTTDTDHFRCYQNGKLTISATGQMSQVVITCTTSAYATVMNNALKAEGYTTSVSGSVITVTLNGETEIEFTPTAQTRLSKIAVTYKKSN